jgi:hypothetical protein
VHLIPQAARVFKVAPQAAARRMFYHLANKRYAIVSLRERPDREWVVSWCSVPGDVTQQASLLHYAVPFQSGRLISRKFVPESGQLGATEKTSLDGLWWHGVTPKSSRERRKPMKRWSYRPRRFAWLVRTMGRIYVAMPLEENGTAEPCTSATDARPNSA